LFRVGEQHVVFARPVIRSARKRSSVEEAWPTALHVTATDGGGGAGDVITTAAIVEGGGEAVGVGGMAGVGYEAYPAPHHAHNNSHAHHAAQYQYAGAEWGQYHPHPHQVYCLYGTRFCDFI
jgi:hypothetical protein